MISESTIMEYVMQQPKAVRKYTDTLSASELQHWYIQEQEFNADQHHGKAGRSK